MSIKTAHIVNYQSHKNTRLDFHDGVNVLVGQSDSGKTAVLRALNWLITNRPAGDAFRSDWGGETIVEAIVGDTTVARAKAANKNSYYLVEHNDNPGAVADEFRAMGQSVPEEVTQALNMSDINIQYQMDSPFLLSSDWSPGRVAEYLNEAAGLDVIDRATANINAKIRKLSGDLASEQARLEDTTARFNELDYLDEIEKKLADIEASYAAATRTRSDEQQLHNTIADIKAVTEKIATAPDYGDANKRIGILVKQQEEIAVLTNESRVLILICQDIRKAELNIAAIKNKTRGERLLNHTIKLRNEYNRLAGEEGILAGLLGAIYEQEEISEFVIKGLKNLEQKWQDEAPDICPLCIGKGRLK